MSTFSFWVNYPFNKSFCNIDKGLDLVPEQQPCLESLGESAISRSALPWSWPSTSMAVKGVTNWCSKAKATILWVILRFLIAVGARDLHERKSTEVRLKGNIREKFLIASFLMYVVLWTCFVYFVLLLKPANNSKWDLAYIIHIEEKNPE